MNVEKWLRLNTSSLRGKLVAITGAGGGLGRELCRHFARLGASLLLMDKTDELVDAISAELAVDHPDVSIKQMAFDMTDTRAVMAATGRLKDADVDYLILNAGVYNVPTYKLDHGYNNIFTINFISPYYIARCLLDGITSRGGKIIVMGSRGHTEAVATEADIDFSKCRAPRRIYGNSKRYMMYSFFELAKRGNVAVAHPGITPTPMTTSYSPLVSALIKPIMKVVFMPPKKACLSVLFAVFNDCGADEWIGPSVLGIWGFPTKSRPCSATQDEARFMSDIADRLYRDQIKQVREHN